MSFLKNFWSWLTGLFAPKPVAAPPAPALVPNPAPPAATLPPPLAPAPYVPPQHPGHTLALAEARYGAISGTNWPDESKWMTTVAVPASIGGNWFIDSVKTQPVTKLSVNKDMANAVFCALQNVINRGFVKELKSYDGCLNVRNVRGSTSLSCHAYGLAIDMNCDTNPLGGASSWSPGFVKCWTDEGFDWGGNFSGRKDPMHFSWGWEGKS